VVEATHDPPFPVPPVLDDEPPGWFEDLEHALIAFLRRNADPRANRVINELAGLEIERADAAMVARIDEHAPIRLVTLAEIAHVDVSTASRQVARLVELGLVERRPDPDDRRASLISPTPRGHELRTKMGEARREWLALVMADFSPAEREQFAHLLRRFVDRIYEVDAAHGNPPG
jgi:DNA-binding MarR family transcriptional regulator